jgi:hypothetical protein
VEGLERSPAAPDHNAIKTSSHGTRLCKLVANHSCAILEAEERGLADVLSSEFPSPDPKLDDALAYKPESLHIRAAAFSGRRYPGGRLPSAALRIASAAYPSVSGSGETPGVTVTGGT